MPDLTDEGVLLADTFGWRLLSYLCVTDPDTLRLRLSSSDRRLTAPQEQVLVQLVRLATDVAATASAANTPVALHLGGLGWFDDRFGTSHGNALRLAAGGDVTAPGSDDKVAAPLVAILRDAYPLLLIPHERNRGFSPLASAIWRSPHRPRFEGAALADPDLSRLFTEESEGSGWSGSVLRSTGMGGGVQLWSLPDLLIHNAWWQCQLSDDDSLARVATQVIDLLDLLRTALRHGRTRVKVLVAVHGVVLADAEPVSLPFGLLRPIADRERELAPPSLQGAVSHTTADGELVTASYAGDVVFDGTMDYRLRIEASDQLMGAGWPTDLRAYETLETQLDAIRLASLLVSPDIRMPFAMVPTWRLVFDPLSWGPLPSWTDPREGSTFAPRSMSRSVAKDLAGLIRVIHEHRRPNVEIAVKRAVSSMMSRRDDTDRLVDLVIALENLFGATEGESTLRVSASLGWLLGATAADRDAIYTRASNAYSVRSQIVHGSEKVRLDRVTSALEDARTLTMDALRELFIRRPDLLELPGSAARSRALILGGPAVAPAGEAPDDHAISPEETNSPA